MFVQATCNNKVLGATIMHINLICIDVFVFVVYGEMFIYEIYEKFRNSRTNI